MKETRLYGIDAEYLSHASPVTVQSDKDSNLPNYAVSAKDSTFALTSLVTLMHEQMERQERRELDIRKPRKKSGLVNRKKRMNRYLT